MKIAGWAIIGIVLATLVYPPGYLWGTNPPVFPFICWQHPPSPYDGLHPYVFMIVALYFAWAVLMIRGAKDPRANATLFDYGFLRTCCTAGSCSRRRSFIQTKSRIFGPMSLRFWL
jgi:hypothetical protein